MKQPDWSTAPEWATVCVRHKGAQPLFAWAEEYKEGAKFLRDDGLLGHKLMLEYWVKVDTRPTTPQWSGTGLPPVGVVCLHEGNMIERETRIEVTVLAHTKRLGMDVAVFQYGDAISHSTARFFHPIRTPNPETSGHGLVQNRG